MRKINFLLLSLLLLAFLSCKEKEGDGMIKLELRVKGKEYKELTLSTDIWGERGLIHKKEFAGQTSDGENWVFYVPDSINKLVEGFNIRTQDFDFEHNTAHFITFTNTKEGQASERRFVLSEKENYVEMSYLKKASEDFIGLTYLISDSAYADSPHFEYDVFYVSVPQKDVYSDFELNFLYPDFGYVSGNNYEVEVEKRVALVKEYPNSKYLFNEFVYKCGIGYNSKEDMKRVFDNFSDSLKNTEEGIRLNVFLTEVIQPIAIDTITLMNATTGQNEPVISDPSKYTLAIFSASWCGPCHKQIPLLKEIYKKLSPKVEFVYITTDEGEGVDLWCSLMEKEEITWRSLIVGDKYKGLKMKYSINGIPFSLLIHPNGEEEVVDVRMDADRKKLYKLAGVQIK